MKNIALASFAVLLASTSAPAQVLLTDNFENANGGASAMNYSSFANWTVLGQVDYLHNYGLACATGSAGCVDLDGSPGAGALESKQSFAFGAGDQVRIKFDLGGNARNADADNFYLRLNFGSATGLASYTGTGGLSAFSSGPLAAATAFTASSSILGNVGFSTWSFVFTAAQAGTVKYTLGTTSNDYIGPLLDNVQVDLTNVNILTVVPEPSTYAMMGLGLLTLGAATRRRRVQLG